MKIPSLSFEVIMGLLIMAAAILNGLIVEARLKANAAGEKALYMKEVSGCL